MKKSLIVLAIFLATGACSLQAQEKTNLQPTATKPVKSEKSENSVKRSNETGQSQEMKPISPVSDKRTTGSRKTSNFTNEPKN
jgi:hypothetical protein